MPLFSRRQSSCFLMTLLNNKELECLFSVSSFLFVCLEVYPSSQQLLSHFGTDPPLSGYSQVLLGVNKSCSRTQHGATQGDRTQNLLICGPMLYQEAAALPYLFCNRINWSIRHAFISFFFTLFLINLSSKP